MFEEVIILQPVEMLPAIENAVSEHLEVGHIHSLDRARAAVDQLRKSRGSVLIFLDINLPVNHECLFFNEIDALDGEIQDRLKVIITTDRGNEEALKSLPLHDKVVGIVAVPINKEDLIRVHDIVSND